MGWNLGYLTAFHFNAMGDLQKTVMPFVTELHTELGQETESNEQLRGMGRMSVEGQLKHPGV